MDLNLPPTERVSIRARWIFPGDAPPFENAILIVENQKIVGFDGDLNRKPDFDLGNVALLPGFVNSHTHLDLSDAAGLIPPTSEGVSWLEAVIAHRRRQTSQQAAHAITRGLGEIMRSGTTLVGDISAGGESWHALATAPLTSVVFFEMVGLSPERAEQFGTQAETWLRNRPPTDRCRSGLSPHAPYSVRDDLFRRAARHPLPTAIHLAEFAEESELLEKRAGPFVSFLQKLGVWDESGLAASWDSIRGLPWSSPPLWIHGNYLQPTSDWRGSLIYCPRTHAAFGHPPHPFREFLAAGINVALGTDSLASNPDLDILTEARWLHERHPDLPGDTLLRLLTLNGAKALGMDHETGSLTPGKWADVVVLPLPNGEAADPHELLWQSDTRPSHVLWRGRLSSAPRAF